METCSYYFERRYCNHCLDYVRFLCSPSATYCVDCGSVVELFSPDDMSRFRKSLRIRVLTSPRLVAVRDSDTHGAA